MKNIVRIISELIDKTASKTRLSKKLLLIVLMLVSGIVLLLASEFSTHEEVPAVSTTQAVFDVDTQEYSERLEQRLVSIISSINGAGATKVMVTLESGSEEVYLHDYDYGENIDPNGKNSVERKDEYVIIDGSSGEQGIVVKVAEPKVRGVAVVCEGGASEQVRSRIVEVVTALLDISSARVSVAQMN